MSPYHFLELYIFGIISHIICFYHSISDLPYQVVIGVMINIYDLISSLKIHLFLFELIVSSLYSDTEFTRLFLISVPGIVKAHVIAV